MEQLSVLWRLARRPHSGPAPTCGVHPQTPRHLILIPAIPLDHLLCAVNSYASTTPEATAQVSRAVLPHCR